MGGIIEMLTASPELYKGKFFTASTNDATTGVAVPVTGPATTSTLPPVGVKSILTMYNKASRTSGTAKNTILIPLYIKIKITTMGTAGTSTKYIVGLDVADRSGAATSLATAMTPRQTRAGSSAAGAVTQTASKATIWSGNITMSAATGTWRQIGVVDWRTATNLSGVAGDVCTIAFGESFGDFIKVPTLQPFHASFGIAPMFIEPDCTLMVQAVNAAQTAASAYELQIAWLEVKNDSVA